MSSTAYARSVQNSGAVALPLGRPFVVTGLGIRGWRPFAIAAGAALLASVVFTGWTEFRWLGDQATIDVDDVGEAVAAFIAAGSCGYAAARNSGRTRIAWALFGLSALSWGAGEVVWSVYQVGMGVAVPFPSAADAGFLLSVPLAVAGVLAFTSAPTRLATRGETVLSGAIVALSLLFIAWELGLGKVYDSSAASPAAQAIGLAYPVGDIITGTVLVVALRRARKAEIGRLALLLGGLAFAAIADSAFAYLTANGTYGAVGSVLDAGWVIGYLMIAVAPLWPANGSHVETVEGPLELWQLALPWIAVLAAAVTVMAQAAADQSLDRFATVLAGSIGVLFVASHVLSHRDSLQLLHKSRRAENALERRNSLLDEIISHAPLGIARVGTDMNVIDVNPRMAAILRTTREKMVGAPVADFLHADEFGRVFQVFQPLWRGAVDNIESDSRAIRGDSSEVWLHWTATGVRNSKGRIEYFVVMYEDTDAEHAANEAASAHLAGLERLNRLKSEFVSLVSHEFRTALVGIAGFSEMIRDEDVAVDEAKAYASDINKEAERLNRMINDMLDLDRIEAGRLTIHIEDVDLDGLLEAAAERTRATSALHKVVTRLDGRPTVRCDPDRIAQVAANLLSNAVKYSPDGGEIAITTGVNDGEVQVSIRDHGLGIAPEFKDKLFGRYERYEKSAKNIIGTGLGLALVRQIVELHGGRVWVDSEPGQGSDFHFALPINGPKIG
ncbi:MAG TPA: PAS domain-containing sensor histidine kinase [Candidatus Limnocylindrales bacterium]|nr:PAS domain-containing sensor histidine kinase [Candidatus Limnocylindrales bacterium]